MVNSGVTESMTDGAEREQLIIQLNIRGPGLCFCLSVCLDSVELV